MGLFIDLQKPLNMQLKIAFEFFFTDGPAPHTPWSVDGAGFMEPSIIFKDKVMHSAAG